MEKELKGGMAVISPLQAEATVGAVVDEEHRVMLMMNGTSRNVMELVEELATRAIVQIFKDVNDQRGEDEAVKSLGKSLHLFHEHVEEKVLRLTLSDKIQRECEGMPDDLAELIANGLKEYWDKQEEDSDDEEEDEE